MAIAVYVHPDAMTAAQYDEVNSRLEASGVDESGRLHHSCFGAPDHLAVYDIWESQEAFDTFAETLMPILGEVGVAGGPPDIMPIYKIVQ